MTVEMGITTPLDLRYMAGMMDADGHFTWRGGKYQAPDIGVTNTSAVLIRRLAYLGGSTSEQRRACAEGCVEPHIHRRESILKWHLTGYRAVMACSALAPHLIIKAEQARRMVDQYHAALLVMPRPARRRAHMAMEAEWWSAHVQGWD